MARANSTQKRPSSMHHKLNTVLTAIVIVLALYIIASPFIPELGWWLSHRHRSAPQSLAAITAPESRDNTLIIPRLKMREAINAGPTIAELRKGVWMLPASSRPDQSSNTVIVGHRFTYAGPAVFYFLDKIQLNDLIAITWNSKEYIYKVSRINIVPPTDLSVERQTKVSQLTLYTCTPLWTAKNRLVIVAPLVEVRK